MRRRVQILSGYTHLLIHILGSILGTGRFDWIVLLKLNHPDYSATQQFVFFTKKFEIHE